MTCLQIQLIILMIIDHFFLYFSCCTHFLYAQTCVPSVTEHYLCWNVHYMCCCMVMLCPEIKVDVVYIPMLHVFLINI